MRFITAAAVCVALIAAALLALRGSANDPEPAALATAAPLPIYVCPDGLQATDPALCRPTTTPLPSPPTAPVYVCADGSQMAEPTRCVTPADEPIAAANPPVPPSAGGPPCFGSEDEIAARLGGSPGYWHRPTWDGGAWVYRGPSTSLTYPGYGWFDTWSGTGLRQDVFGSEMSFHCEEANPGHHITLADGEHATSPGSTQIALTTGETLVGQSYAFNGHEPCQVFAMRGPSTHIVVDGEYWLFTGVALSHRDLVQLANEAEAIQQGDPAAMCDSATRTID